MKEFVPQVYTTEFDHERNIIHLCCSRMINDPNILYIIEEYLKEYVKGITNKLFHFIYIYNFTKKEI